jgi:hypothetical protein
VVILAWLLLVNWASILETKERIVRKGGLWALLVLSMVTLVGVGHADANSIGPDCPTCQGSIYTLTNLGLVGSSGANDEYHISLTIDTSGYTGGGAFIDLVALKISSSIVGDPTLLEAPGGVAAWTVQKGGLNANGCSGAGSGFVCASDGQTAPVVPSALYTWIFDPLIPHDTLLTIASIKVRYVDPNGNKVGDLVSENINLPDGDAGTFVLLGFGLMSVGAALLLERFFKGARASIVTL